MKLACWEAAGLFGLWLLQFGFSPIAPGPGIAGYLAAHVREWVTAAYFLWVAVELGRLLTGRRGLRAFQLFGVMWRRHIRPVR
jgi:hypothetical protein